MAAVMNSSMNSTSPASALGIPEGARRASEGMPRAAAAPDPEVVATVRRRQFSAGEKRALLAEADRCKQAGTLGAFLRSKRIYSSMLSSWRKQMDASDRVALTPKRRGPTLGKAREVCVSQPEPAPTARVAACTARPCPSAAGVLDRPAGSAARPPGQRTLRRHGAGGRVRHLAR